MIVCVNRRSQSDHQHTPITFHQIDPSGTRPAISTPQAQAHHRITSPSLSFRRLRTTHTRPCVRLHQIRGPSQQLPQRSDPISAQITSTPTSLVLPSIQSQIPPSNHTHTPHIYARFRAIIPICMRKRLPLESRSIPARHKKSPPRLQTSTQITHHASPQIPSIPFPLQPPHRPTPNRQPRSRSPPAVLNLEPPPRSN